MSAVTSAGPASCEHAEGSDTTGQHKRKLSEASNAVETVKTENREGAPKKKTKRPYEPHERFWLQDGNVVVHLDGVGFKLHRSRLASQSPWFKALFDKRAGFDPPADNTFPDFRDIPVEVEDGCDVYDLHATYVSSEDFAALLAAMEDAVSFRYSAPSFPVHAAIFAAASSLNFPAYRAYALKAMEEEFSPRLETVTAECKPHAALAVSVGNNWSLRQLYKRAFYELARNPDVMAEDCGFLDDTGQLVPSNMLTLEVFNFQKKLSKAWTEVLLPSGPKFSCRGCFSDDPANYWAPIQEGIMSKFALDPICGLQALVNVDWAKHGHCSMCRKRRRIDFATKRAKLWDDMDEWLAVV
ncbi:hypothetical protein EV715DRAFT_274641 [Schizophyllum commune]